MYTEAEENVKLSLILVKTLSTLRMSSSAALAKAALRRFASTKDSDDEDEAEFDHHSQNLLPLTSAQRYEFKMAYRAVAGNDRSVPYEKVFDVYQAMGYTFQEEDIKS